MSSTSPRRVTLARAALIASLAACAGAVALRPQAAAQEVSAGPAPTLDADRLRTDLEVMRRILDRQALQRSGDGTAGVLWVNAGSLPIGYPSRSGESAAYYVAGDGAVFILSTSLVLTPPKQEAAPPPEKEPTLWDEVRAEVEGRPAAPKALTLAARQYDAAQADALVGRVLDSLREYGARIEQVPREEHVTVIVAGAPQQTGIRLPAVEVAPESKDPEGRLSTRLLLSKAVAATAHPTSVLTVRVARADVLAAASGSLSAEDFRRRAVVHRY